MFVDASAAIAIIAGENDGAEDAALARPLPLRWEWRIIDNRKKVVMMTRSGSV